MRNDDAVEHALDGCFDAIFQPEQWTAAMDALAQSLGALGCCLNPNSRGATDRLALPASKRYRDMLNEFVAGGWRTQDLRNRRGWRLAVAGQPLVYESDCTTSEERARLPIYAELFARHDLELFVCATVIAEGETWAFNLVRSERMGGFEHDDSSALLRVRPSLARVIKVANHLGLASARSAVEAFEQTGTAVALLDRTGQILQVNAAAERMMGQGINLRHRMLFADSVSGNSSLQTLIRAATAGQTTAQLAPILLRRVGKPPLIVEAIRIQNIRGEMFGFNGALLMITDPAEARKPQLEILRQSFGLTPQEARVARLIATGMDIAEIGEMLQIRVSSTQQLSKSILSKTGTRRQGALVALLSRMPTNRTDR